jgi:antitoxin component of RelBE/YafQ-DinJ toxin-antitoxin module
MIRLPKKARVPTPEWNICSMTVLFRCRVDPKLLKRAAKVTLELGTSLPEAVGIFVAQVACTGSLPLSLSTKSGLDVLVNKAARDEIMRSLDETETWCVFVAQGVKASG